MAAWIASTRLRTGLRLTLWTRIKTDPKPPKSPRFRILWTHEAEGIMLKLFPVATAVLFLGACGGGLSRQMEDPKDPDASLVYGYIDMTDGPCWLEWFNMHQIQPKVEKPYVNFRIDEGVFYAEYVPPGSFQLHELGGSGTFPHGNTSYNFMFPKQGQGLRIEKPGLYYLGSFKMKDIGNFFKS